MDILRNWGGLIARIRKPSTADQSTINQKGNFLSLDAYRDYISIRTTGGTRENRSSTPCANWKQRIETQLAQVSVGQKVGQNGDDVNFENTSPFMSLKGDTAGSFLIENDQQKSTGMRAATTTQGGKGIHCIPFHGDRPEFTSFSWSILINDGYFTVSGMMGTAKKR
jgi:hypothetical protein